MTNWFTKNGKVLTKDGKIRGCCCDAPEVPLRQIRLINARMVASGFTYKTLAFTDYVVHPDGSGESIIKTPYFCAGWQSSFWSNVNGGIITVTATAFVAGAVSVSFEDFDAAPAGRIWAVDTIPGGTYAYCGYPARDRSLVKE